ncbi:MAG: site-2 protease family protein [Treponema sp.]|jgi:regulator of sigma E protease|nr:site-2 protease family protein [Treponema sp.]
MLLLKIALGLVGLGIVVFIHELGHFLAARLVKIDVEAFSIGWGRPIFKKKIGAVEYRLGIFPVGGYCKMKGETDYKEIWDEKNKGVLPEKGSYLSASPAARILVCFAGPFFNLILAVLLLSTLWGVGFQIQTLGNKIILASEITPGEIYPADAAGFKTGDKIIEIDGHKVSYYHEIQENIASNPNKPLAVTVERDGKIIQLEVTPALEKSSGAGRIGVSFWTDPVIENVKDGSPAEKAGLMPGDIVTAANGQTLNNSLDLKKILDQQPDTLVLEYERNGQLGQTTLNAEDFEKGIGFSWALINYRTPSLSFPSAVAKGVKESFKTLTLSIKSLRLLFMGIDLTQAVSGPVRITYMMGDMATKGGLRSFAEFISLISIALCMMNLLPLPIIDGGMILLFLVELIRGKPAHPKAISIFQTCGVVIIFCLTFFALFGDIMFFVRG